MADAPGADRAVPRWFWWVVAAAIVWPVAAAAILAERLPPPTHRPGLALDPHVGGWDAGDGRMYLEIASSAYRSTSTVRPEEVFFPGYPLLVAGAIRLGIEPATAAGLAVAWAAFVAAVGGMWMYLRQLPVDSVVACCALLAFVCWPANLFLRFPYSESLLCLLEVTLLLLARAGRPLWMQASVAGLAMVTRPVGIALLAIPICTALAGGERTLGARARAAAGAGAVAVVPMLAFMAFLGVQVGDPLAFINGQTQWNNRWEGFGSWAVATFTLEPLLAAYLPANSGFWGHVSPVDVPLINYAFWNPLFFVAIVASAFWLHRRAWVTRGELVMIALLLVIPYLLQGYRTCMVSQGRYAAVALPAYLAIGHVLAEMKPSVRVGLFVAMAGLQGLFAVQFVRGYFVV